MNKNKEYKKKMSSKGIYRVLKENKGICECIAQTFRNIMLELGEECRIIRSETHSWNIIKKNNRWYHLDLTWDLDNIKNGFYLQYFFKGQNKINEDHEHDYIIYIDKDMQMSKRSLPYSYSKK